MVFKSSGCTASYLLIKVNGGGYSILFLRQPYSRLKNPSSLFIFFSHLIYLSSFNGGLSFLPFPFLLWNGPTTFSLFKNIWRTNALCYGREGISCAVSRTFRCRPEKATYFNRIRYHQTNIRYIRLLWFHQICK